MKVEITRTIRQKEIVDVEFPYFYQHDLSLDDAGDTVIYGKIEEKVQTTIKITSEYGSGRKEYELAIERRSLPSYACYINNSEYASSKEEFLAAKAEAIAALNQLNGD